jgi:hypothetical protein
MRKPMRERWREYQDFMVFLNEYLPAIKTRHRGTIVIRELLWRKDTEMEIYQFLRGDYIESLVRRYLRLPTVQHSRRELDAEVKRIQAKANKE